MKLGVTSAAYRPALRSGQLDLREWLRMCARDLDADGIDFDAEDLAAADPRELRELKRLCTELQLTVASIGVDADLCADASRVREVERIKQTCDMAAYLGAPVLRVTAGAPSPPGRGDAGVVVGLFRKVFGERGPDRRHIWSDVMWALRACADYAAERGVVVALQNGGHDAIVPHGPALAQAVRDVGSPWLRACPDPALMPAAGGMDLPLPSAVQARLLLRRVLDEGADAALYWPEVLRALKLAGYRGFVLLDYAGEEDAATAMPRAMRYARGILQLLQRQELLREAQEHNGNGRSPQEAAEAVRRAARGSVSKT